MHGRDLDPRSLNSILYAVNMLLVEMAGYLALHNVFEARHTMSLSKKEG